MNNGFEFKIGDIELRIRRCYEEDRDAQVVELSVETFKPAWFLSSLCLTPDQATLLASALLTEAVTPCALSASAQ